MTKGEKFWCWWASRYVYFDKEIGRTDGHKAYIFYDICDVRFVFNENQLAKLRREK